MIRVLIADDHTLLRTGVRSILLRHDDIEIVGETSDGAEALRLIQEQQPDVVLMDIMMPAMNGLEATARVSAEFPKVRVLILSMHANEEYVLGALRAGAAGYLVKDTSVTELVNAIVSVARGETYLSPSVLQAVTDYVRRTGRQPSEEPLTARQREVLKFIAEGKSTKQIAQTLGISVKTVETHRTSLMKELDLHDVASVVRFAIRAGVIEPHK
jgi:DNA-binding NarL/FixJ family response regulator